MNIFGYKINLQLKIKKTGSVINIDPKFQKRVMNTHSQYFEDVFISNIFRDKMKGFYIDIGANDPDELNNTKVFHERGWRGINIEPNMRLYEKICRSRSEDTNLNVGVGEKASELIFYEMNPDTLSTFNKAEIAESVKRHSARVIAEKRVPVITMKEVFDKYIPSGHVDFISIDTEGFESQVLAGNDWARYRPAVILMEIDRDRGQSLLAKTESLHYQLVYHNGLNGIFADKGQFL